VLGFIYGAFLLSIGYHVLMNSINLGVDASAGWYLYSVIAAEAILVVAGLLAFRSGKAMIVGLLGCFLLLEVYAMHFLLIPYYTGLIAHAPDGGLRSFHLSQLNTIPLAEILSRLEINRPFFGHSGLIVLWFLFIAAAIALPYISARSFSGNK